ncbi:probable serine/threonine-protein kinase roco5 [Aplysia californica]|uniref:Probable serine/threonine-protein kinase roco5 n=1 Tax=Aplysia californica TaxID=6500 RepID=A0ABM0JXV6_APLCA|nr:probable serine/threonine-protein kinase roco5 [Aplysia californica]
MFRVESFNGDGTVQVPSGKETLAILKRNSKLEFTVGYFSKPGELSVVKKFLLPRRPSRERFGEIRKLMERYKDEVTLLNELKHDNIIVMTSTYQCLDYRALVLEYIPHTLLDCISARIPFQGVQNVIYHISKALCFLQTRRIAHGDVKLENVRVTKEGVGKLCDFTRAQKISAMTSVKPRVWRGTEAYLAPEMKDESMPRDAFKMDHYAFGVVMWSACYFILPAVGLDYLAHVEKSPHRLNEFSKYSLKHLLSKHPEQRTDINQICEALKRQIDGQGLNVQSLDFTKPEGEDVVDGDTENSSHGGEKRSTSLPSSQRRDPELQKDGQSPRSAERAVATDRSASIEHSQSSFTAPTEHSDSFSTVATTDSESLATVATEHSQSLSTISTEPSQSLSTVPTEHFQNVSTVSTDSHCLSTISTTDSQSLPKVSTEHSQSSSTISTEPSQSLSTVPTDHSQSLSTASTTHSQSFSTVSTEQSPGLSSVSTTDSQSLSTVPIEHSESLSTVPTKHSQSLSTVAKELSDSLPTVPTEHSPILSTGATEQSLSTVPTEHSQSLLTVPTTHSQSLSTVPTEHSQSLSTVPTEHSDSESLSTEATENPNGSSTEATSNSESLSRESTERSQSLWMVSTLHSPGLIVPINHSPGRLSGSPRASGVGESTSARTQGLASAYVTFEPKTPNIDYVIGDVIESLATTQTEVIRHGEGSNLVTAVSNEEEDQAVIVKKYFQSGSSFIDSANVAIKLTRRFEKEVSLLKTIDHPRIIRLISAHQCDTYYAIIMEHMDGTLDQGIPYADYIAESLLSQIAEAICYLHERGIVHGHITLEHILVSIEYDIAKLSDLDSAQIVRNRSNKPSFWHGRAPYMAPEFYDSSQRLDAFKMDNYAFGVVMWSLCYNSLPFEETDYSCYEPSISYPIDRYFEKCLSMLLPKPCEERASIFEIRDLIEKGG